MLSTSSIGSASGAADYYGKDDYYVTGEADSPGLEWGGKGAASVGLTGKAEPGDFKAVLSGEHQMFHDPDKSGTGNEGKHRAGWDLTFSAPKSVSLAILVGGDKRLDAAHDKAVASAMKYAEKHFAITRVRDKGAIKEVKTGNLVYASTVHGTSRHGDPQRHTHVIVANASVEPQSGKVRALESLQLFKNGQVLGRIYQAELGREAMKLGYDVQRDSERGTIELAGFSKDQLRTFSKRNVEITAAIKAEESKTGNKLSPAQRDAMALRDRPKKIDVPRTELVHRWESEAKAAGLDAVGLVAATRDRDVSGKDVTPLVSGVALDSRSRFTAAMEELKGVFKAPAKDPYGPLLGLSRDKAARTAVSFGLQVAEQGKAVFTRHEVLAKALEFGQAGLTAARIEKQLSRVEKDGLIQDADARLHGGITTKAALTLEKGLLDTVTQGKGKAAPMMTPSAAKAALTEMAAKPDGIILNEGQRNAAEKLLTSQDKIVGIQGFAGVGKTTMFRVVNDLSGGAPADDRTTMFQMVKAVAESQGAEIRGLAPTHKAAEQLKLGAGIESSTVENFLQKLERAIERGDSGPTAAKILADRKAEWEGKTLLVDESSMLSNRQSERLLKVAEAIAVGRVIFIGDEKQLGSPEAGAPWRLMLNGDLDHSRMTEIRRQKDPEIKAAVEHLAKGQPTQGLRALGSRIVEVGPKATDKHLAKAAFESWSQGVAAGKDPQIIVPTHALRSAISGMVRSELADRGTLSGPEVQVNALRNVRMTTAEAWRAASYSEGQVLVVHMGNRATGIRKGDILPIVGRDERNDRLIVESPKQGKIVVDLRKLAEQKLKPGFQAYVPKDLGVQAGEKLVWEKGDETRGFRVGQAFHVAAIEGKTWTIRDEAGQETKIPANDQALRFVTHGYVETADRSQGSTYPDVVAVLSSQHGEAANQARAYVQASRAAEGLVFVTNTTKQLANRLNRNDGLNLIATHEVQAVREARAELAAIATSLETTGEGIEKQGQMATLGADGLDGREQAPDPAQAKSLDPDQPLAGTIADDQVKDGSQTGKDKDTAGDKDKAFDKAQEIAQPEMGL